MANADTLKYMFSIKAGFPARWVAKTPAGYRIDVEFHTARSEYAITVDVKQYWQAWGKEVREWLLKQPTTLDDWKALLTKEERPIIEALAKKLTGEAAQNGATLETEAGRAELGVLLADLREYFRGKDVDGLPWLGLSGHIVSGVDWALLRADGVVEFDGQWVLADGNLEDKNAVLVNARTSGSVDLCSSTRERPLTLDHAVATIHAIEDDAQVGIALAMKFEAPQEPEPWASKKYTRRKGQLRYIRLSRGQFVAIGKLKAFGKSAAEVQLDVYQVKV
jgi:hypothetical protein